MIDARPRREVVVRRERVRVPLAIALTAAAGCGLVAFDRLEGPSAPGWLVRAWHWFLYGGDT